MVGAIALVVVAVMAFGVGAFALWVGITESDGATFIIGIIAALSSVFLAYGAQQTKEDYDKSQCGLTEISVKADDNYYCRPRVEVEKWEKQ